MTDFADNSHAESGCYLPRPKESRPEQWERLGQRLQEFLNDSYFDEPTPEQRIAVSIEFRDLEAIKEALVSADRVEPLEADLRARDRKYREACDAESTMEAARIVGVAKGKRQGGRGPYDREEVMQYYRELVEPGSFANLILRRWVSTKDQAIEATMREFGIASFDTCVKDLKDWRPKQGEPGFFSLPSRERA